MVDNLLWFFCKGLDIYNWVKVFNKKYLKKKWYKIKCFFWKIVEDWKYVRGMIKIWIKFLFFVLMDNSNLYNKVMLNVNLNLNVSWCG